MVREYLPISKKPQKGFTLIELLVVVAIMVIVLVVILARFTLFGKQTNLDGTAQQIISILQMARSQTVASLDESVYGVHFETNKYVLFKGATYNPASTDNKEYTLNSSEIYEINLSGGGGEVVFDRIKGSTSESGNVKIRLTTDNSKTKTIVVTSMGASGLENVPSPTDTLIFDSRHLCFDLGWSIQGSSTLNLIFSDPPNPDVVKNVATAAYFNPGKTEFNWSGTVTVNGSDQVIKVHTHLLNTTNTILSVHRDRRYNNKAVQILFNTSDIVSYTADGVATVGNYGGTMSRE
jgi:prepilin-type N-terminal cleavage/methylation domain-containing protein